MRTQGEKPFVAEISFYDSQQSSLLRAAELTPPFSGLCLQRVSGSSPDRAGQVDCSVKRHEKKLTPGMCHAFYWVDALQSSRGTGAVTGWEREVGNLHVCRLSLPDLDFLFLFTYKYCFLMFLCCSYAAK